jgi:hypothetical protein
MTLEQKVENAARQRFEEHINEGTKPYLYTTTRLYGGEYVSMFTEEAWKNYWRGYRDAKGLPVH